MQIFRLEAVKSEPDAGAAKTSHVYRFRANDGEYDRYNDRLSVQGWKLADFNLNPVIFYNHDSGLGLCSDSKTLPIGKGRAFVEGDALLVDIEFDQDDEFAKRVEAKVEKGILNAVSVGYRMVEGKFRQNDRKGYDSDEQELLEISIVTIPGNQRALRIKAAHAAREAFTHDVIEKAADAVAARVIAMLDARQESAKAVPAVGVSETPSGDLPSPEQMPAKADAPEFDPAHWESEVVNRFTRTLERLKEKTC